MHITKTGKFIRSDIWREGKWLDLWSVVHCLSGASLGFFPRYFDFDTASAFLVVFLLLVMYEMFEVIVKIEEARTNRFMDVVVGMASFAPVYFLNERLGDSSSIFWGGVITTFTLVMATLGWLASNKALQLEIKMRAEVSKEKEKFKNRFHAGRDKLV